MRSTLAPSSTPSPRDKPGYFTAAQALEVGYSYPAQAYHHKAGHWLRDGWGVYRLAHFPSMPREELVRLRVWSRDRSGASQAVASHETALELYDLSDVMPTDIHLTVPKGFRKASPAGPGCFTAGEASPRSLNRHNSR